MSDDHDVFGPDEFDELHNLADRGAGVRWESPPEDVWQRITHAISEAGPHQTPDGPKEPNEHRDPAPVVPLPVAPNRARPTPRGTRPWVRLAAAAAVILAAGTAGALMWLRGDRSDVIAQVELTPLGPTGSGRAELIDTGGTLRLRVDTSGLVGQGEDPVNYLELWLIDPTVTKLVSLGPLRDDGLYDLPSGVDPAAFPIVDVSIEPVDGDPTHSGQSILRGELPI